ncbi:CREBRF [Cordylochernes scorpioides]|uniref:CREBRF n=1 Tax=Cordylochernes scorpioides TaxID=51811 RepID=A0ABY6JYV3_9ARAC|nr:CREBRF [Cordylochernes scorpioides]
MELCTPLLKNNCNLEKYAADEFHISLIWTKNLTALLKRYEEEGNNFLDQIVTGDESWCYHYDPSPKRASMEWKRGDSPRPKKKNQVSTFGRQRMNSDLYCDILVNKLKPGIRNKRRGKLSKGVLFLHDNARPHTSCKTVSTIIKLGFEVLEHPAYSPDLAPSDYFLFGLLKKELKGKRFDSDEDVQKVVKIFFTRFLRVPIKRVLDFEAEPIQSTNQWGFPDNVKIEDIFQVEQGDLNLSPTLAELNASTDQLSMDPTSTFEYILPFSPDDGHLEAASAPSSSISKPLVVSAASSSTAAENQVMKGASGGANFMETSVTSMDWSFDPIPIKQEMKPNILLSTLSSSCPATSHFAPSAWRSNPLMPKKEMGSSELSSPSLLFSPDTEDRKPIRIKPEPSLLSTSAPVGCGLLAGRLPSLRQRNNSNTDKSLGSLSSLSISNDEGFDSHDGEDSNGDDDLSSDGESLFTEEPGAEDRASLMLDLSSTAGCKKKKRYFWQYNTQSKGPKGSRLQLDASGAADPHVFHDVADPVFSADGLAPPGVKHSGKARRGDGNDLTPNPRKLFSIGLELRKLNKVINELAPSGPEMDLDARPVTRKEKNKLASRACRLKKKAQHEANKLKLHGLQDEHKKLLTFLGQMRGMLLTAVQGESTRDQLALLSQEIGVVATQTSKFHKPACEACTYVAYLGHRTKRNDALSMHRAAIVWPLAPAIIEVQSAWFKITLIDEVPMVAGQTTEFVNSVLEKVSHGDPSGAEVESNEGSGLIRIGFLSSVSGLKSREGEESSDDPISFLGIRGLLRQAEGAK